MKYTDKTELSFNGNKALAKVLGFRWNSIWKVWESDKDIVIPEIIDTIEEFGVFERNGMLICAVDYDNSGIARRANFSWDKDKKVWCKQAPRTNVRVVSFSDCSAHNAPTNAQLRAVGITSQLYAFQLAAVGKMVETRRCYNGSDMGNGKSIMSIAAAALLVKLVLIICPASLKHNWRREILKHTNASDEDIQVMDTKKNNVADSSAKYIIINYDIITKVEGLSDFVQGATLILDEAHYIKSPTAIRTGAVMALCKRAENIFMLSGTPITKNAADIYTAAVALKIPNIAGHSEYSFKNYYCHKVERNIRGRSITQYSGVKNADELRENLFPQYLRYEAREVDLPDYATQHHYIEVSNAAIKKLQKSLQEIAANSKDMQLKMQAMFGDVGQKDVAFGSLKKLLAETKVSQTVAFVKDLLDGDDEQQVVVYSDHVGASQEIAEKIKGAALINGDTSSQERDRIVTAFQAGDIKVLVGTSAISTGLTLTAANILVVNDCSWNVATDEQLEKRIHRIGQEKKCIRYNICLDDSRLYNIDDHIATLLKSKRDAMGKMKG